MEVYYFFCMTHVLSFRSKLPRKALERALGCKVGEKITELLDQAIENRGTPKDWGHVLGEPDRPVITNEQWESCLAPE